MSLSISPSLPSTTPAVDDSKLAAAVQAAAGDADDGQTAQDLLLLEQELGASSVQASSQATLNSVLKKTQLDIIDHV